MGLWGKDFEIVDNKDKILNKIKEPKKVNKVEGKVNIKKSLSIEEKLSIIEYEVNKILGVYKDKTVVIYTREELHDYISKAIENGIIAIDTETNNSLDPLTCKLMGPCLYTPGMKNAYVPINHRNHVTRERLSNQCTEQDVREEFARLGDTKIVYHNAKFDYKVIYCTCDIKLSIYWDTMVAARILNENERAGLKQQYIEKIDPSIEKYSIDHLFKNVEYADVPPEVFALYAATDSFMTYELYKLQKSKFEEIGNERLYKLLLEVEFPITTIVAEMELNGVALDTEYCERLHNKYHERLDEINIRLDAELAKIKPQIDAWRQTEDANYKPPKKTGVGLGKSKSEQLADPPELTSTVQLSILLYDIMHVKVVDKSNPRGTGEDILKQLKLPLTEVILEQRTILKMLNAFIDALPEMRNPRDNKIHSNFNQLGTDTGRFSCTSPNLQQIPSANREIRMMFTADPGYLLVGSDFGAQEPRIFASYSREQKLLDAFKNDRDVYATLGEGVYRNDYWDNMEHFEDGSPNIDGKKRRKKMKTLLLGMLYGMQSKTLSERMGVELEEANRIVDDFHSGFPQASEWIKETEEEAKIKGYVEDFAGRRRNLPDLLLPEYSFKLDKSKFNSFNPLLGASGNVADKNIEDKLVDKYKSILEKSRWNEYESIKSQAEKEGLKIVKNGGFINRASRQCVNARVQGGAATMTKKAMISIYNDELMKKYGFQLLIGVHDELIGQCKEEYAKECSDRLTYLMVNCVPELDVTFKCDPEIEKHWYENEYCNMINKEYSEHHDIERIYREHCESTKEKLNEYLQIA